MCICMRRPLSLNSPFDAVRPAAATLTANKKDDDANDADADNDDDDDDDNDDDDGDDDNASADALKGNLPASMPPKKKTPAATSKTEAVDAVTDALKKASVSSPKAPVFVPYSTKVMDAYFVCTFIEGGERLVEVDLNLAAALCSKDDIKAVLSNDGMSIQFQRGVFSSFFMTRRLRKDLAAAYNPDSSMVAAHRNVYDNFKAAEANNTRAGFTVSIKSSSSQKSAQDWLSRALLVMLRRPLRFHSPWY